MNGSALAQDGMTALARAAKSGHVDIVQLLLEHGARVGDKAHVSTFILVYALILSALDCVTCVI